MTLRNFTDAKYRSLESLTGIRGAASVWVVIYHFGQGIPGYSIIPSLYSYSLVSNGFRGVDLFFIYPVQVRTRKSLGEMMRKLSVTASQ